MICLESEVRSVSRMEAENHEDGVFGDLEPLWEPVGGFGAHIQQASLWFVFGRSVDS